MSIYDKNGNALEHIFNISNSAMEKAYDVQGRIVFNADTPTPQVDYNNYSFIQKWPSKGISATQGFDIYDDKVFWVQKSGNATIPSNCYVWNLADGTQALDTAYITIYSGHGNNLCFDFPTLYATSAYTPDVYINTMTDGFMATLTRTLYLNDGCIDCDACIDQNEKNIMWSIGHTSYTRGEPFIISKWDLNNLTDNGDGTYTPQKLQSVNIPQNSYYFQGCKFHDNLLWYCNWYNSSPAYVRAINPNTGIEEYVIDLSTTTEVEGCAWVEDESAVGGYALYVGFQGMMLRKYTFGALT